MSVVELDTADSKIPAAGPAPIAVKAERPDEGPADEGMGSDASEAAMTERAGSVTPADEEAAGVTEAATAPESPCRDGDNAEGLAPGGDEGAKGEEASAGGEWPSGAGAAPPLQYVGEQPATAERPPLPEELLAMAGQHMIELGTIAHPAMTLVQSISAQAQATGYLIWQMSQMIQRLTAANHQLAVTNQQLAATVRQQGATINGMRDELENREAMPPLPPAAQEAFDDAENGTLSICDHCFAWRNTKLDKDGHYTHIFCNSCRIVIAARHRCQGCNERVFVDPLGNPAKYCKDCVQDSHCHSPGCSREANRKGLCSACYRSRRR